MVSGDVFTPLVHLEVDGVDRTEKIWEYVESIDYEDQEEGQSDTLSLVLADGTDFAVPDRGAKVRFWLGWKEETLKYIGTFIVDEVSVELSPAKMSLSAKSADFEGAKNSDIEKQKRDREWENITLADLTTQIATRHRCKAKVEISVYYPHVAQTNESDLQFVARLTREAGGNFVVRDRTWLVTPPDRPNRPKATIVHTEGDVSGRFTFKDRTKYKSVAAKWWDVSAAEEKTVRAGSGDPTHTVKRRFSSPAEAEILAKNTLTKLNRQCVEGELELAGRGDLVAGAEVTLERFPKGLDGNYLAKAVSHSVSRSAWTTLLRLERLP